MNLVGLCRERAAHHQPHNHFGAFQAAQPRVIGVRQSGESLRVFLDQLQKPRVPLGVIEARRATALVRNRRRRLKMATAPQTMFYQRQRVAEGRLLFGAPSRRANHFCLVIDPGVAIKVTSENNPNKMGVKRSGQVAPLPLVQLPDEPAPLQRSTEGNQKLQDHKTTY